MEELEAQSVKISASTEIVNRDLERELNHKTTLRLFTSKGLIKQPENTRQNLTWKSVIDMVKIGKHMEKAKLKSLVRQGIPDQYREKAWTLFSHSELVEPREDQEGRRMRWIKNKLLKESLDKSDLSVILRDVPRTFPTPSGQKALFAVLKCFVISSPETGYCQGMNYIAATLMRYTTPENSLMIMISLFQNYGVEQWYDRDFSGLRKDFYVLLRL